MSFHKLAIICSLKSGASAPIPEQRRPWMSEKITAAMERLSESLETLTGLGFQLEPFGPGLIRCSALPAATASLDPGRLVRDLLDSLPGTGDAAARRRRLVALTACHAAVRLGDRLDPREQLRLLERLVITPGGLTCPHGRPTVIVLDDRSLRRAFGRPTV